MSTVNPNSHLILHPGTWAAVRRDNSFHLSKLYASMPFSSRVENNAILNMNGKQIIKN
jgi:hypothetical protein